MRKYLLMLLGLAVSGTAAHAMTANDHMDVMKGLFVKEFNQIDANKDGQISKEEFINHQFESLRANLLSDSENETPKTVTVEETETEAKVTTSAPDADIEMAGVPSALKAMAEFDLDMDDNDAIDNISIEEETVVKPAETKVTKDIDLSVSEDDNLKNLLKEMDEETASASIKAEALSAPTFTSSVPSVDDDKDKQINMMMDTIRNTLPKKIDDITTWTDIEYKNSTISYIYKADIDTSKFSSAEKASLEMNIKNEACVKAYADMCPRVKPMFIDDGINVEIRYYDSNNKELSSCKFNKETCGD